VTSAEASRLASGIGEVDRVLGGGFVPGSIVLFGGDPGIGKSTLLLQLAARLATNDQRVLYVTGEESAAQVRGRAERIGAVVDGLSLAATTDLETALAAIESLARPGGRGQRADPHQRRAGRAGRQRRAGPRGSRRGWPRSAKAGATCIALVGHVTKEGTVAGPRTLEHLVDAVIYLEGERLGATRLLRAAKNRFGSTDEVGVLEMRGDGLAEVADASRFFLESDETPTAGAAVTIALEGTRPLAVEIQALSAPSAYGSPRRATTGIDVNRVHMLIAVLARHAGAQPLRARRVRQRRRRPAHRGAGGRPGRRGGAGLEPARAAGPAGHGARRRGGPVGTAARGDARRAAPARGLAAGLRAPRDRPPMDAVGGAC
jgi:DNA repair protein RadA/Sms